MQSVRNTTHRIWYGGTGQPVDGQQFRDSGWNLGFMTSLDHGRISDIAVFAGVSTVPLPEPPTLFQ